MHRVQRLTAVVLAVLALSPATAGAAVGDCRLIRGASTPDTADDVQICREDVWIHQSSTKAGNAAGVEGAPAGGYPSWNTTRPTASVQSGAGGGYLALAAYSQNAGRYDGRAATTFRGTVTGHLDNLAATLYLFTPARSIEPTQAVSLRLMIDGQLVYVTGDTADRTPLEPAGDAVMQTRFAFEGLHAKMAELGLDTGGVHTVELVVSQWFTVNDNALYVYDTTEVPAGIVFNLEAAALKPMVRFAANA